MRGLVVVGASAGGVDALARLASGLPDDLDAAVLMVLHVSHGVRSAMPAILTRAGRLPAEHPRDGEAIRPGRIYVAPPDRHLMVSGERLLVTPGPKENGHRPAIDPALRSAAEWWGPNVMGVILSGTLDDGATGLAEVRRAGGVTVVQSDALFPHMVESARHLVTPDYDVPLAEIPVVIARWAREPRTGEGATGMTGEADPRPVPVAHTCPECGGTLWETEAGNGFRCRVGHVFSDKALLAANGEQVEAALWTALRSMEERRDLFRRIAVRNEERRPWLAKRYRERSEEIDDQRLVLQSAVADAIAVSGVSTEDSPEPATQPEGD
ncbi:MAG TPA: chemotaxis protein CheB [Actinomycetota bacterium]|nr:chemotaxis protein CheB [Actinomycetota bacterium]